MKAQLDQHDELGWLLDLMLDKARTGSQTARACPKAVERAHARLLRERELLKGFAEAKTELLEDES